MSIQDQVSKVVETLNVNEVNELLKKGWRLLEVVKQGNEQAQYPLYIVGKTQLATLNEMISAAEKGELGSE